MCEVIHVHGSDVHAINVHIIYGIVFICPDVHAINVHIIYGIVFICPDVHAINVHIIYGIVFICPDVSAGKGIWRTDQAFLKVGKLYTDMH